MSAAADPGTARCVLLDRDGVLNEDLPTGVLALEQLRLIPGAAAAVALLHRNGFRVLVLTNQACVGRGELAVAELGRINAAIDQEVATAGGAIAGWYICTHRAQDQCPCRKPAPGLILQAQTEHGFDPAETWFIGDAARDCDAALAAGCQPILVRSGKGAATSAQRPEIPVYDDLFQAAQALLGTAPSK